MEVMHSFWRIPRCFVRQSNGIDTYLVSCERHPTALVRNFRVYSACFALYCCHCFTRDVDLPNIYAFESYFAAWLLRVFFQIANFRKTVLQVLLMSAISLTHRRFVSLFRYYRCLKVAKMHPKYLSAIRRCTLRLSKLVCQRTHM